MSNMNAQYISNSIACWDMSMRMEIFIIIHHGIILIVHTTNSLYLIGWTKSACVKTTAPLTFDWNICPTLLLVEFRLGELVGCKTLVPLSIHICSMSQWELDFLERRQSIDNFSLSSSRTVGSSLVCALKQFTPDHPSMVPLWRTAWHWRVTWIRRRSCCACCLCRHKPTCHVCECSALFPAFWWSCCAISRWNIVEHRRELTWFDICIMNESSLFVYL